MVWAYSKAQNGEEVWYAGAFHAVLVRPTAFTRAGKMLRIAPSAGAGRMFVFFF
jgi:hypothetical protein